MPTALPLAGMKRLGAAPPRAAAGHPQRSGMLDVSVALAPWSHASLGAPSRPLVNLRKSAAKCSGSGLETASSKLARRPRASACERVNDSGDTAVGRRIAGPILRCEPPLRSHPRRASTVDNATKRVLFASLVNISAPIVGQIARTRRKILPIVSGVAQTALGVCHRLDVVIGRARGWR